MTTPPGSAIAGTAVATPRPARRKRPRWGFAKGATIGLLLVVPLCAVTVWTLARLGLGNPGATMIETLRMAFLFAGLAGVLTAGGVGRLAAQASAEGSGGRRRAALVAARTMAAGGAGLTLIAAIPLGHLPGAPAGWIALALAGAVAGALGGAVIGLAAGGPMPTLTELGVWPIEPIEWTRDLLGLDDKREAADKEEPGR